MKYRYNGLYTSKLIPLDKTQKEVPQEQLDGTKVMYEGSEGVIRFVTSYSTRGGHGEGDFPHNVYVVVFKDFSVRTISHDKELELL